MDHWKWLSQTCQFVGSWQWESHSIQTCYFFCLCSICCMFPCVLWCISFKTVHFCLDILSEGGSLHAARLTLCRTKAFLMSVNYSHLKKMIIVAKLSGAGTLTLHTEMALHMFVHICLKRMQKNRPCSWYLPPAFLCLSKGQQLILSLFFYH